MRIIAALALALQFATPELEQEYRRTLQDRPATAMFTVLAQYGDGTPARGYIACDGEWCKYGAGEPTPERERSACAVSLPFKTDSRGACIFNPHVDWLHNEYDDEPVYLTCWATAGTRSGKLTFPMRDKGLYIITIPGNAP